ncbi:MAG: DNA-binding protein [Desulfobacterales bacterium]|nr:DNA-binding protein [Desulfobacterales bacterium]
MKYSQANLGRIFTIRLEDGEIVHKEIEKLAEDEGIKAGALVAVGGVAQDSRLVVGPADGSARPVLPMLNDLTDVHEIAGTGTLFPDDEGKPTLHMHMACGRNGNTITGCIRNGVKVWQVMELILFELVNTGGVRVPDAEIGFKLLDFLENKN